MLTLAEVFEALCGTRPANTDLPLREVSVESQQVRSNALFAALPGTQSNGHNYIGDAFHRGARLALIERDLWHRPLVLIALLTLMAGEWALRRRWGLR